MSNETQGQQDDVLISSPPRTHVGWATAAMVGGVLFSTVLGAPAGFVARRHGRQVQPLWNAGDQQGAIKASRTARTWAIVSTVLDGLGLTLLVVVISLGGASPQANYHSPAVVAASLKTLIQKRISDPSSTFYSPGVKVTSVVCTPAGKNTDTCVDTFSNGQSASETAVISADGQRFVTR